MDPRTFHSGATGLVASCLLALAAQAAPLDLVPADSADVQCLFDSDCLVFVADSTDVLATTGGFVQSRRFPVGEPGTVGAGSYAYLFRVDLIEAVGVFATECVKSIDLPFGRIERFDYDADGDLDDLWEGTTGLGDVHIDTAEQLDDTLRITFAGSGVCQGAFAGDGDTSFFFGLASRHDSAPRDGSVAFELASSEETVTLQVPDVPVTAAMEDYAFAWADQPGAAIYTPNPLYSYNRAGGPITIARIAPGAYEVVFGGMDTLWNVNGNAQVTAYGASYAADVHCNTGGWTDDTVNVHCYDDLGNLTDATFVVLLAKPMPIRDGVAHVFADQPTTAAYAAAPDHLHNPGGGPTTITRTSTGRYRVSFGGFGNTALGGPGVGGNVQVTSVLERYGRCRVTSWTYSSGSVNVACNDENGLPTDARFSLLWTMPTERFDRDVAYAWSNTLATSFYEPNPLYATNPADDGVFGSWLSPGRYAIEFQDLGTVPGATGGHVQVTSYGSGDEECAVRSWNSETVFVDCFTPGGSPANAPFSLLRLQPTAVPEPGLVAALGAGAGAMAGLARRRARRGASPDDRRPEPFADRLLRRARAASPARAGRGWCGRTADSRRRGAGSAAV